MYYDLFRLDCSDFSLFVPSDCVKCCDLTSSAWFYRSTFSRSGPVDDDEDDDKQHQSQLQVNFFSFTTFYHLVSSKISTVLYSNYPVNPLVLYSKTREILMLYSNYPRHTQVIQ